EIGIRDSANIVIENREGVLTLPESAIEFTEGKSYVHVLTSPEGNDEQTFDKREIEIGLSDGIRVEIVSGITADDKVRGAKEEKK
ncbi:MAG: efflux transporter periplasmic adaptor subunit, partial [Alistipes sp.]|nr:efflux transporter periplasmic adaptor subunit [Alistipes sp.]